MLHRNVVSLSNLPLLSALFHSTLFLSVLSFSGCSSTYYAAMEKIGIPKRDLMIKRVSAAQDSQEQAKEQFKDALERFRSVLSVDGGVLEEKYNALSAELERTEKRATDVHNRIDSVEDVSEALFAEWQRELSQYSNSSLRYSSEEKLRTSRDRYQEMMRAMRKAESKLEPVLQPLRDNVLFLKHNLNARAISSLDTELRSVEVKVDTLIRELEQSIDESNRFIKEMEGA